MNVNGAGEKRMGFGDIKGIAEITDRTMSSQSCKWQVEKELMKKTEMKPLLRGWGRKNSERVESQKANSSSERIKNVA